MANIPNIPNIPDGASNIPDIPVGAPNIPNIPDGIPNIPNVPGKAPAIPNVPSSDTIAKQLKEIEDIERKNKKEKQERAKASEAEKQKEEIVKQEIKQLRNKLNNLAGKWEKEGKPMVQAMPQLCEEYLKKLESSLTEDKNNCHFWQTPLYKKYEWDSIGKCVSLHRKLVELNFDSVKKDISGLDNISKKITESLEMMESSKDDKSYETQLKSVNDQLKKYESCINQLIDDVPHSLLRFYRRMNRFKTGGNIVVSGRPEPYLGKDSALKYCLSE